MLIRSKQKKRGSKAGAVLLIELPLPVLRQSRQSRQQCNYSSRILSLVLLTLCLCYGLTQATQLKHQPPSASQRLVASKINSETREPRSQQVVQQQQQQQQQLNEANGFARTLGRHNVDGSEPASPLSALPQDQPTDESSGGSNEPGEDGEGVYESSATSGGDEPAGSVSSSSTAAGNLDYNSADSSETSEGSVEADESGPVSVEPHRLTSAAENSAPNVRPSRQSESSPPLPPSPSRPSLQQQLAAGHMNTELAPAQVVTVRAPLVADQRRPPTGTALLPTQNGGNNFAGRTVSAAQAQMQQSARLVPPPTQTMPAAPTQPTAFGLNAQTDRSILKSTGALMVPTTTVSSLTTTAQSTSSLPPTTNVGNTNNGNGADQEMATESVRHELLLSQSGVGANSAIQERRQDLLYPSASNRGADDSLTTQPDASITTSNNNNNNQQATNAEQQFQEQAAQMSSVCHTPVALFTIIFVTMLTTMIVCFCTHALFKRFGRHQFDLIATSKQYNANDHGIGYLEGATTAQDGSAPNFCSPNSPQTTQTTLVGGNATGQTRQQQVDLTSLGKNSCTLNIFGQNAGQGIVQRPMQSIQGATICDETLGCAFENPYFSDESNSLAHSGHLSNYQHSNGADLVFATNAQQANLKTPPINSERLHFIDHHISNLHSRQVTSSVKELSILGSLDETSAVASLQNFPPNGQVVDLTNQRQQQVKDLKEGDLIAVDISGHDFIGLGFDVCGNERDGIFIDSVLNRGPAKESGCIQAGDRIKSLNISFDNMTLQDAYDLLNCGSPYKMRLLLEKQALNLNGAQIQQQINRLSAPPAPMMLKMYNSPQQPIQRLTALSQQQLNCMSPSQQSSGPVSVTRTYIKRLTNLVASINSSANKEHAKQPAQQSMNYLRAASADQEASLNSSENRLIGGEPFLPVLLGSAVARSRHHAQTECGPFVQGACVSGHENAGYGTDDNYTNENGDGTRTGNETDNNLDRTSSTTEILDRTHRQLGSRGISIGSNRVSGGARRRQSSLSVQSASSAALKTPTNESSGPESSLDFQNQNANHKLHGPQMLKLNKGKLVADGSLNLALADQRRQSAAAASIVSGSSLCDKQVTTICENNCDRTMRMQLEQTQSQPEICMKLCEETSPRDKNALINASNSNGHQQQQRQQPIAGDRRPVPSVMMNSVSTPTINLATSSSSNRSLSGQKGGTSVLRVSSRGIKNYQQQPKRDSIREENISRGSSLGGSEHLFAVKMESVDNNLNGSSLKEGIANGGDSFDESQLKLKANETPLPVTQTTDWNPKKE